MGLEDFDRFARRVARLRGARIQLRDRASSLAKMSDEIAEAKVHRVVFDDFEYLLGELGKNSKEPVLRQAYAKVIAEHGAESGPISYKLHDDGYYVIRGNPRTVAKLLELLSERISDLIPEATEEYGRRARVELSSYLQRKGIPVSEEHLANYDPQTLYKMYWRIREELPPWYLKYLARHGTSPRDALDYILHFEPPSSKVTDILGRDPELRSVVPPSVLLELSELNSKPAQHFLQRVRALKGISSDLIRRVVESVGSEGYIRLVRFADLDDLRAALSHPDPRVQSQLFRILRDHGSIDAYARHLSYSRAGVNDPHRLKAILRILARGDGNYVRTLAGKVHSGDSPVVASLLLQLRARRPDLWRFVSLARSGKLSLPEDVRGVISGTVREGLERSAELASPSPALQSIYRARDLESMVRHLPEPTPKVKKRYDPEWRRVAKIVEKELKKHKLRVSHDEVIQRIMEVSGYDISWARDPRNRPYLVNAFIHAQQRATPASSNSPASSGNGQAPASSKSSVSLQNEQYYAMGALAAIRALANNLGDRASMWRDGAGRLIIEVHGADHERKLIFKLPHHLSLFANGPIMYMVSDNYIKIDKRSIKNMVTALREVEQRLDEKNRAYVQRFRKYLQGFVP